MTLDTARAALTAAETLVYGGMVCAVALLLVLTAAAVAGLVLDARVARRAAVDFDAHADQAIAVTDKQGGAA
jgi:hypothetical protein